MIEARGTTKRYVDGSREVVAVDRAGLAVESGEFVLIIGRSGSGKSTLLSMLGGLTRPNEGSVFLGGADIWAASDAALSRIRAEQFGFVFQFSGLLPTLSALENVMFPTLFSGDRKDSAQRAAALLASMGLEGMADAYPSQLSGGELKRVAIARALINDPAILFADEPTGDLDVDTEQSIMEQLGAANRMGKTIVMVTHNPELSAYADRVYRMERGSIAETAI